eukprot:1053700-Alexandrium_andersonii.AAC.1
MTLRYFRQVAKQSKHHRRKGLTPRGVEFIMDVGSPHAMQTSPEPSAADPPQGVAGEAEGVDGAPEEDPTTP